MPFIKTSPMRGARGRLSIFLVKSQADCRAKVVTVDLSRSGDEHICKGF